jgi:hypothetical protein
MFSKCISPAALTTVSLAVFFAAFGWLGAYAAYAACGVPATFSCTLAHDSYLISKKMTNSDFGHLAGGVSGFVPKHATKKHPAVVFNSCHVGSSYRLNKWGLVVFERRRSLEYECPDTPGNDGSPYVRPSPPHGNPLPRQRSGSIRVGVKRVRAILHKNRKRTGEAPFVHARAVLFSPGEINVTYACKGLSPHAPRLVKLFYVRSVPSSSRPKAGLEIGTFKRYNCNEHVRETQEHHGMWLNLRRTRRQ